LLMGVVQGAVRASCGTGAAANHEQAADRLNHLLCMKTARERFVSLFWCFFDRKASVLRYINAGHLPPLLVRYEDEGEPRIVRLDQGGPVLGLLPGARYSQAVEPVMPGDLLVVFSDGILEATNSSDDEFGEQGIVSAIEKHWSRPPSEICAAVLEAVRVFLGKELPHDDQTLLIVRLDHAPLAANQPETKSSAHAT
jgi:sigma-B regulation protein RsbU (phosphoserine phosphatase)